MRKKPYTLRFHTNNYEYLGNHPEEKNNQWSENAQGVATDQEHWYLSKDSMLFKYHVSTNISGNNEMVKTGMPDNLADLNYTKFKAICYHDGFIFVPIQGKGRFVPPSNYIPAPPPAIAMFDAMDLSYVAHVDLLEEWELGTPGWLAVHPKEGRLYTTASKINYQKGLYVFDLSIHNDRSGFDLEFSHEIFPRLYMIMNHMQGGVFSPEGQLYLVNGYLDSNVREGGISVFSMQDFHFRQKSKQRGPFRYQWDTSWNVAEEPEGICFWDLDEDNRAPHISGQLHTLLLDNDWSDGDDVYMKHYRISDPIPRPVPEFTLWHLQLQDELLPLNQFAHLQMKGITHNHQARFFASSAGLHRYGLEEGNPTGVVPLQRDWTNQLTTYDHISDICYTDGYILVAFSAANRAVRIASFSAEDLRFNAMRDLDFNGTAAFLGVNALTREHLHVFDQQGNIRKYRMEIDAGRLILNAEGNAYRLDERNAPIPIRNVTGGEISAVSGFFYIVHDGHVSVFHSDGSFVDSSAIEYHLGNATFDGDDIAHEIKFITTDPYTEPFLPGVDFNTIPDAQAMYIHPNTRELVLRSWEIRSIMLVGNKRSKELHQFGCPFQRRMAHKNYVFFKTVETAIDSGYNGCYYCMRRHDTG